VNGWTLNVTEETSTFCFIWKSNSKPLFLFCFVLMRQFYNSFLVCFGMKKSVLLPLSLSQSALAHNYPLTHPSSHGFPCSGLGLVSPYFLFISINMPHALFISIWQTHVQPKQTWPSFHKSDNAYLSYNHKDFSLSLYEPCSCQSPYALSFSTRSFLQKA